MSTDVSVLGQKASPMVANQVLNSSVMNANPSPKNPLENPNNTILLEWSRLITSLYALRRHETDKQRLMQVEDMIQKATANLEELGIKNEDEVVNMPSPAPQPNQQQPGPPGVAAPAPMGLNPLAGQAGAPIGEPSGSAPPPISGS